MSIQLIQDRLDEYKCQTELEEENAIKEIVQEICLAGLSRSGFFREALFQGGTCLRILYNLPRFSEDLDFILKGPNKSFEWKNYFNHLQEELSLYGFDFELQDRSKAQDTIKKTFLKNDSWIKILNLKYSGQSSNRQKKIVIKIEIDTNPPSGGNPEEKILDFPFPFTVIAQDLPSLFAGKGHALLCRPYVKGRDWYDFLWYVRKKIKPNYQFLQNALIQQGPWKDKPISVDKIWFQNQMRIKIKQIDWEEAGQDIARFIKTHEVPSLNLWSAKFFLDQLEKVDS